MKKLFVPIVAVATMLAFTSCGDDVTAPEITLPTEPTGGLVIDLGDETAALKDVTAKDDKDGDVTASLKVAGLDFVGVGNLTYSVLDKANNTGTKSRPVTIKSGELKGTYEVKEIAIGENTPEALYQVTISQEASDATMLYITGFGGFEFSGAVSFVSDGRTTKMVMKSGHGGTYQGDPFTLSGDLEYKGLNKDYQVYEWNYQMNFDDEVWNYKATLTRKAK